jgi:hypothetical protein
MPLHLVERHGEERREGCVGSGTIRQVSRLHMPIGTIAFRPPSHKEECRTIPTTLVRVIVSEGRYRIRPAVRSFEGRRPAVQPLVPTERGIVVQRRRTVSRTRLASMNPMLAGRSARRRMR